MAQAFSYRKYGTQTLFVIFHAVSNASRTEAGSECASPSFGGSQ